MSSVLVFDDVHDALLYLEVEAEMNNDFLKGELFKTADNRWRLGIIYQDQLEFGFEDQNA